MSGDGSKETLFMAIKRLLEADDLDFLKELKKEDLERLVVVLRDRVYGNR